MRVLVASKFWHLRGGLERVMFEEIAALERGGHDVAHFATAHPENVPSPYSAYFPEYSELGTSRPGAVGTAVRDGYRVFANAPARRSMAALVEAFRPDVVHVHGIHRQLSPSILAPSALRGAPVVQTLHDYHHICPADVLLRGGTIPCVPRRCGRYSYVSAVAHSCMKHNCAASALSASETAFQRLRHVYERRIARFISPSCFMRDVMVDGGWTSVPFDVLPNPVPLTTLGRRGGEHFLYVGRLSPEKGVDVALRAADQTGLPMVVAGAGPSEGQLKATFPSARFLGHLDQDEISRLLNSAIAAVVPSIALENAPLAVLEAMAAGVPVIASNCGGISEMIDPDVNGILVTAGDSPEFAAAMLRLANDAGLRIRLGDAGRRHVEQHHSMERHLSGLLASYEAAIAGS